MPAVLTLVLLVVAILAVCVFALFERVGRLEPTTPEPDDFEQVFESTALASAPSTVPLRPAVALPPEDATASTAAIADVYRRVFSSGLPQEVRDALVSDPALVQGALTQFATTKCATDSVAVVTKVDYTSSDSATVEFRFEGPNVPEIGRGYYFTGGAFRQPGGPWQATPEGINSVIQLGTQYCN